MFDQMIAHAIKVFDRDSKSATFWYLCSCEKGAVRSFCRAEGIALKPLRRVADKLRTIRNETHFHLDRSGVLEPKTVWKKANLRASELSEAMGDAYRVLDHLHVKYTCSGFSLPEYDGADATQVAKFAEELRMHRGD